MKKIMTTAVVSMAFAAGAQAAIMLGDEIGIDFGATTNTSNYNVVNIGTPTLAAGTIVDLTGSVVSGVSFAVTGANSDNGSNNAGNSGITDVDVTSDGIINNVVGADNGSLTLTFSGLDDSLQYSVFGGLSRNSNAGNFATTWTFGTGNEGITIVSDATSANGYQTATGLQSTGGELIITINDDTRNAAVSSLVLTATNVVPEPSSTALLGLGGLALILRRRK